MKVVFLLLLFFGIFSASTSGQDPVRIGIAGLSHSHVLGLLRNMDQAKPDGVVVGPTDLAALELNLTVVEILEAARESSLRGKKVELSQQELLS